MPEAHSKNRLAAILLTLALLLPGATVGLAQEAPSYYTEDLIEVTDQGVFDSAGNTVESTATDTSPRIPTLDPALDGFEAYQETIISNWGGKRAYTQMRLKSIRDNLQQEIENFDQVTEAIDITEDKLRPIHEEIKRLSDQINLYNEQLRFTRQKIQDAEKQIAEKQVDMKTVMEEMKISEAKLNIQKEVVLDYVALLYQEEAQYLDLYTEGTSTLKLLLADASVSENLMGREYVAVMEQAGRKVFHDLEDSFIDLQEKKATLLLSQTKLNRLTVSLENEKSILEQTRQSKKTLLERTKGEQEKYEALLEESIQQQLESALAIQNMKDNIGLIESKLDLLEERIAVEKLEISATSKLKKMELEEEIESLENTDISHADGVLSWPIPPVKITAQFHDPTYPKRWGVHNAVDLRARHFTPIEAPANGYVVEAKDNGMGYSYIILAHKNNLVTVYGHVSEISVRPGMLVEKGEIIGRSGGTPGTKGAGLQTTGPHLHFEVHFNGKPVDPLDYLPVYEMPIEQIPKRFLIR